MKEFAEDPSGNSDEEREAFDTWEEERHDDAVREIVKEERKKERERVPDQGGVVSAPENAALSAGFARGIVNLGKAIIDGLFREAASSAVKNSTDISDIDLQWFAGEGKDAAKMSPAEVGDFLSFGREDWHQSSEKSSFLNLFTKELKGSTNADFYVDRSTGEVFLKTNKGGQMIPTGFNYLGDY